MAANGPVTNLGRDGAPMGHMDRVPSGLAPWLWVSLRPFGIGHHHPGNFGEVLRAVWENRDRPRYAWRILTRGCCDGCALGTAGLRDWTMPGIHLCNVRLRLLRLNTMGPMDPAALADVAALRERSGAELRAMGRLAHPMLRRRGEAGFARIGWDEALALAAERVSATRPERVGVYLTSRGIPNETYYAAQKAARALGTNNVDNAARVCHAPSTTALKATIGAGATTCSYADWIGSDLVVFVGSNVANNQPVATKYLYYARKAGTRIVLVNATREPGMERYWIPSTPESALFGTRLAERTYLVDVGGDVGFLTGALKHVVEQGWVDGDFIAEHTAGYDALRDHLRDLTWEALEQSAGTTREAMLAFAREVGQARSAVFVWSMGVTHHEQGEAGVRAIVNLALTRGFLGRERCGLMPIRGHSGVQGGAEMGCYSTVLPGGVPIDAEHAARLAEHWGFGVPTAPGLTAPEMLDAAHEGALDVLWSVGGNFLDVLPDPARVAQALERVPLRVHHDIVVSSQMLRDPGDAVLLLPAPTRYEMAGGVTETSTERRVIFSPEIPGPRIRHARAEGDVLLDVARRVRPHLAERLGPYAAAELRAEIARVIPAYDGIQHLRQAGDAFQIGGAHLGEGWRFGTDDGRACWSVVPVPAGRPEGLFRVATRRGKQFNSMVHEAVDPLNGAGRDAVFMAPEDARDLGVGAGARVRLVGEHGALEGIVRLAPARPGNLQVHWPEGNVLIDPAKRSPTSGVPDYNALVRVEVLARPDDEPLVDRPPADDAAVSPPGTPRTNGAV